MPGIFSAFTDAQAAGQKFGDSVAASKDLQQAMQDTPKNDSGQADLFTTYSKAGQIAMQSGHVNVADKFLKQANEYKGAALEQKLNEMKVQDEQLSRFEQHIQGLETADELKESLLHSEVPVDQKMRLMSLIDKDPKKFKELMLNQTRTSKERVTAEKAIIEQQRKQTHDEAQIAHWANQDRNQAGKATGKPTQEQKDETKIQDKLDAVDTHLESEIAGIEGKDPHKFDEKEKARQIASAKNRAQVRKQQLQQRQGNKKTADKKESKPSYNDWLKAAKEKNPGVPDSELKAFYDKKYKE